MQVNLLSDLRKFFESANPDPTTPDYLNSASILNLREIPVITSGREMVPYVLAVLENLIDTRIKVKGTIEALRSRIMKVSNSPLFRVPEV